MALSHKNTLRLLRIPFSVYLMPVFCFALLHPGTIKAGNALLLFIILHLLVYPASNGYNSYMDRDTGSIGGLERPPMPTRSLFHLTLAMDILAVLGSLLIGPATALMILAYILVSRAYSYRGIRLKQYPVTGLLTVVVFQGAFTCWLIYHAVFGPVEPGSGSAAAAFTGMAAASCLLAANYPLTQVYQHDQDRRDKVRTISILLGYRGTFLFSGIFFLASLLLLYGYFFLTGRIYGFALFLAFSAPVMVYFTYWFIKVSKNQEQANFENTMRMNRIAAFCMIACFLSILIADRF
jgi:1,4-dihydroxy-2-naphthoate polyprenyltransferase